MTLGAGEGRVLARSWCGSGRRESQGAQLGGRGRQEQPSCFSFFLLPGPVILISGRNSPQRETAGDQCAFRLWLQPLVGWLCFLCIFYSSFRTKTKLMEFVGKKNGMKGRRGAVKELNYFFLIVVV